MAHTDQHDELDQIRANGCKPVEVTKAGVRIGDEPFPYPILEGSISVARAGRRHNALTLTILVGEVTMPTTTPTGSVGE